MRFRRRVPERAASFLWSPDMTIPYLRARILARRFVLSLSLSLGAMGAVAAPVRHAPQAGRVATGACAAGHLRSGSGYRIEAHAAKTGDLPYLLVLSRSSGNTVRIYYDPALKGPAMAAAGCLSIELDLLQPIIPDPTQGIVWMPIVVTRDRAYRPPSRTEEHRWPVTLPSGRWDAAAETSLIQTMPHEETHGRQWALRAKTLPRWFQEGHADWAGLQVTDAVRPELARQRRDALASAAAAQPHPVLGTWGGIRVKQAAIDRQLSRDDLARRQADPAYVPKGPFTFRPGDFETDQSDGLAYYAAALAVFDALEARHGKAAVTRWIADVLASHDNAKIVALAQQDLGEDIGPLLR
jgi:hypothetical protein